MANISLEASIRTCKVDTGWSNKLQSDRFLNPQLMVCPVWNGQDSTGRRVCPDSFVTKTAGCNSAEDRVAVENYQRPQYMEYINLDAQGIRGDYYNYDMFQQDTAEAAANLKDVHNVTGQFGYVTGFRSDIYPRCSTYPYVDAMQQLAMQRRSGQALQQGFRSNYNKKNSGM